MHRTGVSITAPVDPEHAQHPALDFRLASGIYHKTHPAKHTAPPGMMSPHAKDLLGAPGAPIALQAGLAPGGIGKKAWRRVLRSRPEAQT